MPYWERSRAAGSVIPTTPPFDAEYAICPTWPSNAAIDAVWMHTPRSPSSPGSLAIIALDARRSRLNVPIRLIEMMISNGISGCGPFEPATFCAQPVPAHATAMRTPPSAAAARSTAAWTCSSSRTSQLTNSTPSSCASASPFSAFTSAIVTRAPRECRARTVASPSPEAPPVTIAALPSKFIAGSLSVDGDARQGKGEPVLWVGEEAHELQARGGEVALQAFGRELGADLGA